MFIYLIWEQDSDFYKVGVTTNTEQRLNDIQSCTPHKLTYLKTAETDRKTAFRFESAIKDRWRSHLVWKGKEWFELDYNEGLKMEDWIEDLRVK
jgi:predicted GIY-YIG superfamily endonuclease